MLLNKLMADLESRGGISKVFQAILGISLLTNAFMALAFFSMDKTVRTVFIPTETHKSFWVDGRALSPEYLEQMGVWVIQQYATVTPSSIDYQSSQILKYVHPSVYGDLSIRFKINSNRLKSENISRFFLPRDIRISEKGRSVVLIGAMSTWVADKRVTDEQKAFLVTFDYDGSQTYIKELRETSVLQPFEPVTAQSLASVEEKMQQEAAELSTDKVQGADQVDKNNLPPPPKSSNPSQREVLEMGGSPTVQN